MKINMNFKMTTNRKRSIDRLLGVNERKLIDIEEYAKNIEDRNDSDSFYVEIKNFLENIRSILDYFANDLAELTNSNLDKPYFPYCHPKTMSGRIKTQTQIENEFNRKINDYPNIQLNYQTIYNILKKLQGKRWVSRLIESVNPLKHNNLRELGQRMIRIRSNFGSIKIGGVMTFGENIKLFIRGRQVETPTSLSPDEPILKELSNGFENVDTLNEKEYQLFIKESNIFQKRTTSLINRLYEFMP